MHLVVPAGELHTLELVVQPHLPPSCAAQRVIVERDGEVVAEHTLTEPKPTPLRVDLPAATERDRTTIRLHLPDRSPSPAKDGRPVDRRTLGVFCSQCRLLRR